jgi:hypothetical protein
VPDVIKNTNLKIVQRVVATDDHDVPGGSMSVQPQRKAALTTFSIGIVAVFQEGTMYPCC